MEALQSEAISTRFIKDGKLRILIREEKREISHINYIALQVGDTIVKPSVDSTQLSLLGTRDGQYLTMHQGDAITLEFDLRHIKHIGKVRLLSAGYYDRLTP